MSDQRELRDDESEELRDLNRTRISSHDFEQTGKYLAAARRHAVGTIEYSGLLSSAVVSYARPFSMNEKLKGAAALSKLAIELDGVLTAEERLLHDAIIELRNKAIAHAEYTKNPVRRVDSGPTGVTMAGDPFDIAKATIDLDGFARLINHFGYLCFRRILDIGAKLPGA